MLMLMIATGNTTSTVHRLHVTIVVRRYSVVISGLIQTGNDLRIGNNRCCRHIAVRYLRMFLVNSYSYAVLILPYQVISKYKLTISAKLLQLVQLVHSSK